MNQFFKLKRKLHYFVNLLFYFIIFIIGYIFGGGKIEKIIDIFNNIF